MPLFCQHRTDTEAWGIWKIAEPEAYFLSELPSPDRYAADLSRFTTPTRRMEYLAVRLLVSQLVGGEFRILYAPDGRPLLTECEAFRHISITHTKGYAAVYLHRHTPVGIDIEYRSDRVARIRSKFMSEVEEEHLCRAQETDHLLLHWSAKEALFKVLGLEEVDFREHLAIAPFIPQPLGRFKAEESRSERSGSYWVDYLIESDFVLTRTSYSCQMSHEA